jgi:hypothetical protein
MVHTCQELGSFQLFEGTARRTCVWPWYQPDLCAVCGQVYRLVMADSGVLLLCCLDVSSQVRWPYAEECQGLWLLHRSQGRCLMSTVCCRRGNSDVHGRISSICICGGPRCRAHCGGRRK